MNPTDLSSMHDIIVPEFQANFWPLAWGYWLMIVLGLTALGLSVCMIRRHLRIYRAMHVALQELKTSDLTTQQVHVLLKRVAIHYHGRHKVASLAGSQWMKHLKAWTKPQDHLKIEALFASQYQARLEQPLLINAAMKKTLKQTIRQCSRKREVADALL